MLPCSFRRNPEHYHLWPGSGPKFPTSPGLLWWDKEQHKQTDTDLGAESEVWDPEATVIGEQGMATLLDPLRLGWVWEAKQGRTLTYPLITQYCVEDSVTPIVLLLNFSLVGKPLASYGNLRPVLAVDAQRLFTASVSPGGGALWGYGRNQRPRLLKLI